MVSLAPGGKKLSGSCEVVDLARETSSSVPSGKEDFPPQEPPAAVSCSGSSSEGRISAAYDSLVMVNVNPSFSYHALHALLKAYGTVVRIRLVYDKDFPSNSCYVTFLSCDEARLAYEHVASLPLAASDFKTELLHSRNTSDSETDYIPNLFDHHSESSVPEVHQIPLPRWFVAYYKNGRGNFIHASRYLAKEICTIPEGNLKKYGKGVLVRAKDITQARMFQHLPCPTVSMFETVKAHPTFNYSKGCVYSRDIYEFPEEEILAMCPTSVQKVNKMKNSSNIVLLTFFGSTLPDRVNIGPINLRVMRFISLPLQCFLCYGYGHGKNSSKLLQHSPSHFFWFHPS
ncbi:hypothetical protein E2C01_073238 [Portunus trituberculatus]|uniref:RRM domain-containing protein n=1 Tax=Portunus trituberculatus TaxID=210409 RepID=A0A5B7I084_PORTR|nr:hypothetical protein [Portunus trituberculatus]